MNEVRSFSFSFFRFLSPFLSLSSVVTTVTSRTIAKRAPGGARALKSDWFENSTKNSRYLTAHTLALLSPLFHFVPSIYGQSQYTQKLLRYAFLSRCRMCSLVCVYPRAQAPNSWEESLSHGKRVTKYVQLKERGSSHLKRVYVMWVSSREVHILCSWCRMYSLESRMCSLGVHASMFIRTSSDNIAVCVCVCVCVVLFVRVCLRVCPCACCSRACLSIGGFQGRGFRFTVAKNW